MPREWEDGVIKRGSDQDVFRSWLLDIMRERGVTMTFLSESLGEDRPSRVQTILRGYGRKSKRRPNGLPFDEVGRWAEIIGLTAPETEKLRELASLDHCEPWFRERFLRLRADATRLAREQSSR